jgi:hypothetical protein
VAQGASQAQYIGLVWLRPVNTARNLERIADHAAKIAESVIYLKQGGILRQRPAALPDSASLAPSSSATNRLS